MFEGQEYSVRSTGILCSKYRNTLFEVQEYPVQATAIVCEVQPFEPLEAQIWLPISQCTRWP